MIMFEIEVPATDSCRTVRIQVAFGSRKVRLDQ